jgi:hypothetical protein
VSSLAVLPLLGANGAHTLSLSPNSMIEIYRPDSLIVGTRGRSESIFKMGAYMGSISK